MIEMRALLPNSNKYNFRNAELSRATS